VGSRSAKDAQRLQGALIPEEQIQTIVSYLAGLQNAK
jgi:hypothetical protein